jgi:hypothetical protein
MKNLAEVDFLTPFVVEAQERDILLIRDVAG